MLSDRINYIMKYNGLEYRFFHSFHYMVAVLDNGTVFVPKFSSNRIVSPYCKILLYIQIHDLIK